MSCTVAYDLRNGRCVLQWWTVEQRGAGFPPQAECVQRSELFSTPAGLGAFVSMATLRVAVWEPPCGSVVVATAVLPASASASSGSGPGKRRMVVTAAWSPSSCCGGEAPPDALRAAAHLEVDVAPPYPATPATALASTGPRAWSLALNCGDDVRIVAVSGPRGAPPRLEPVRWLDAEACLSLALGASGRAGRVTDFDTRVVRCQRDGSDGSAVVRTVLVGRLESPGPVVPAGRARLACGGPASPVTRGSGPCLPGAGLPSGPAAGDSSPTVARSSSPAASRASSSSSPPSVSLSPRPTAASALAGGQASQRIRTYGRRRRRSAHQASLPGHRAAGGAGQAEESLWPAVEVVVDVRWPSGGVELVRVRGRRAGPGARGLAEVAVGVLAEARRSEPPRRLASRTRELTNAAVVSGRPLRAVVCPGLPVALVR